MISRSRVVANRVKRRSLTRSNRRISLSPGKKSNIVVVVRVRPENVKEQGLLTPSVIQVVDRNLLIFDPVEEEEDKFFFQGVRQSGRDFLKKPHKNISFNFDYVFDGNSTNEDVFNSTTKSIIDGLLNGINSSVFAYGATGAGKTFTMIGTPENPGIIFLMVMALFERIEQLQDKVCDISISYLEVYNESIKDLLTPSPPLMLREDGKSLVVSGLSHFKPNNTEHLMQLLHFGNKNRTQHPTDANSESSRSHAVFQVYVRQKDKVSGLSSNIRMAKMSLIDLAGSERATVVSNREKARLREGASINQSLLALGSCINALADRKKPYIPYRNSKLTRILKDSLGGNCFTVMIAAVSPCLAAYEDSYNTLKYADRAKCIQLTLKRNVVNVDAHVTKYVKIVEEHQKEIVELRTKLKHYENLHAAGAVAVATQVERCSVGTMTSPSRTIDVNGENAASNFVPSVLVPLQEEYRKLRERYLDCESALRLLKAKKNWKLEIQRIHNILYGEQRAITNTDTRMVDFKEKRLMTEKLEVSNSMESSKKRLQEAKMQTDIKTDKKLEIQDLLLQHSEDTKKIQHFLEVANLKARHEETNKSVLESLARIVRRQQYILEGRGVLTPDLVSDLESIISQLHGVKEVNWADEACLKSKLHPEVVETYRLLSVNKEPARSPLLTPSDSCLQAFDKILGNSSEKKGYPPGGWCNPSPVFKYGTDSNPISDPVRRSLDKTFSIAAATVGTMSTNKTFGLVPIATSAMLANPVLGTPLNRTFSTVPVAASTTQENLVLGTNLNGTFSPVPVAASTTPESPVLSAPLNRTFTPVYEKVPRTDFGPMRSYADIVKFPAPMQRDVQQSGSVDNFSGFFNQPSTSTQTLLGTGANAVTSELLQMQKMTPQQTAFSTAFLKTISENAVDVAALGNPQDLFMPLGQHNSASTPRTLQATSIQDINGRRNSEKKMPKLSWARPFSLKMKAKENRCPLQMSRQTSLLPRPGTFQNKQRPLLYKSRSTSNLSVHKSKQI